MKLDDYDLVEIICDTCIRDYNVTPNNNMRVAIHTFLIELFSGKRCWYETMVIGNDEHDRDIYLSFSGVLHAYVGPSNDSGGRIWRSSCSPCVREAKQDVSI